MVKPSERFKQDDQGQWWYHFGKKRPCRIKANVATCRGCGAEFVQSPIKRQDGLAVTHCSRTCGLKASYAKQAHPMGWRGEKSRRWKGGEYHTRNGYVMVMKLDHPELVGTTRRYVRRCRLVMEEKLGRLLKAREQVHHMNGIRDDDRPENLELWVTQQPAGAREGDQQHCPTCTCFAHAQGS